MEPRPGDHPGVEHLRRRLRAHRAGDDRESRSIAVIVSELDRLERPLDQHADLTHVTASAVVVGPRGVILHRHRRLHRWLQPGGHIDPGETPEEAAMREVGEETGLAVVNPRGGELLHVDVHRSAAGHVHLDLRFLLQAADAEPEPAPGESREVAWFTWEEAVGIADEALVGALLAARRLTGAPGGDGARGGRSGDG
jgi:8-oxo-dGTP pyrophosphatase MutT (NUDIX family)